MRKTIPLAAAIAGLAVVTIVTGLVRSDADVDGKASVSPLAQVETVAGPTPGRLRVKSFDAI